MEELNSWDTLSETYNNHVTREGDIYHKTYLNPKVLELLCDISDQRILDLACGNGYFSEILSTKNAIVFGVDYSKKLIAIAKKQSKGNATYLVGKTDLLKFENDYFDSVVINMALQDIENLEGTFSEVNRVLKGDGDFIFSIPHPAFFLGTNEIDSDGRYKKIQGYMTELSFDHPFFPGVNFYHRTIGCYLNTLRKFNLVLDKFEEITVQHDKGILISDENLMNFKREIPSFLIVKAFKHA